MTSPTRSMLAAVSCSEMSIVETMRDSAVSVVRYVAKATNVPTVIRPCSASHPPTAMLATSDTCGSACSAGWKRALSFAERIRRA